MVDALMYREDYFVLLQSDQAEQFLTPAQLHAHLEQVIISHSEDLPPQLAAYPSLEAKATYLRDNFCQLNFESGEYLQWYVVRLEK